MIGDIISGVKFLFELIKDKRGNSVQDRKAIFTNFIEPIYDQLETAHKKYLENFQQYRELVSDAKLPMNLNHPIFEVMQKDHALSDAERAKIVAMSEYLNTYKSDLAKEIYKDPMGQLAGAVINYITTPAHELTQKWGLNAPRNSLLVQLEQVAKRDADEEIKKEVAKQIIDKIVEELQGQYGSIIKRYMTLKGTLLI